MGANDTIRATNKLYALQKLYNCPIHTSWKAKMPIRAPRKSRYTKTEIETKNGN